MGSDTLTGSGFFLIALILAVYFLPSLIATSRHHHNAAAIFLLNLLLGWTALGWIGALVWSATAVQKPLAAPAKRAEPAPPQPPRAPPSKIEVVPPAGPASLAAASPSATPGRVVAIAILVFVIVVLAGWLVVRDTQTRATRVTDRSAPEAPLVTKSVAERPGGWLSEAKVGEDDRATIMAIQQALAAAGYNPGLADGIAGPRTQAAIRAYQQANGLAVNGEATRELLDHIEGAGQ